jgi:hypothetical protein
LTIDRTPRRLGHHGEHEGGSLAGAYLGEANDVAPWRLNNTKAIWISVDVVDGVVQFCPKPVLQPTNFFYSA